MGKFSHALSAVIRARKTARAIRQRGAGMSEPRDEQLKAAVLSLNRHLMSGFEAIGQCLDVNSLEHGIVQAVRLSLEADTSVLWRLTILNNVPKATP